MKETNDNADKIYQMIFVEIDTVALYTALNIMLTTKAIAISVDAINANKCPEKFNVV